MDAPVYEVPELSLASLLSTEDDERDEEGRSKVASSSHGAAPSNSAYPNWEDMSESVRREKERDYISYQKMYSDAKIEWERYNKEYRDTRGALFNMLYETTDAAVINSIMIDTEAYNPVLKTADSLALYRAQRKYCSVISAQNITQCTNYWRSLKQEGQRMMDFMPQFEAAWSTVVEVSKGTALNESDRVEQFYNAMANHWKDLFVSQIITRSEHSNDSVTYEDIKRQILKLLTNDPTWETRKVAEKSLDAHRPRSNTAGDGTRAMNVNAPRVRGKRPRTGGQRGPPTKQHGTGNTAGAQSSGKTACHNCEGIGHTKSECTAEPVICPGCHLRGHVMTYCKPSYVEFGRKRGYTSSNPQPIQSCPWKRHPTRVSMAIPSTVGVKRKHLDEDATDATQHDLPPLPDQGYGSLYKRAAVADRQVNQAVSHRARQPDKPVPMVVVQADSYGDAAVDMTIEETPAASHGTAAVKPRATKAASHGTAVAKPTTSKAVSHGTAVSKPKVMRAAPAVTKPKATQAVSHGTATARRMATRSASHGVTAVKPTATRVISHGDSTLKPSRKTPDSQGALATPSPACLTPADSQGSAGTPKPSPPYRLTADDVMWRMGKWQAKPGRGENDSPLTARLCPDCAPDGLGVADDPLKPVRELDPARREYLFKMINRRVNQVNAKIRESIDSGRRPDAVLLPHRMCSYPGNIKGGRRILYIQNVRDEVVRRTIKREQSGGGTYYDVMQINPTPRQIAQWRDERDKYRDVTLWPHLTPSDRYTQFHILTTCPRERMSEQLIIKWLYWYPHHSNLASMGRQMTPVYDMPITEHMVPAFLPIGWEYLFSWCTEMVPEVADIVRTSTHNVCDYEVMLRAYRTWNIWSDGTMHPPHEVQTIPDYGDTDDDDDDQGDDHQHDHMDCADDDGDRDNDADGNSQHTADDQHQMDVGVEPSPERSDHSVVLRKESLYSEDGFRKSPCTIDEEEKAGSLHRAYLIGVWHAQGVETNTEPIYLDSGAGCHVLNAMHNIKKHMRPVTGADAQIEAFGGSFVVATHCGYVPGFGRVLITPDSEVTLISSGQLDNNGYECLLKGGCARISRPGVETMVAPLTARCLYELSSEILGIMLGSTGTKVMNVGVASTEAVEKRSMYSPEQVRRATEVATLHAALNHPSETVMTAALDNAVVVGTSLTGVDVTLWKRVYGPCTSCEAAKTRRPHYGSRGRPPSEDVGERIHMDLYTFKNTTVGGNTTMLIGVDDFSDYMTVIPIKSKDKVNLMRGFNDTFAFYRRHGSDVQEVCTDHEVAFTACYTELGNMGVTLQASPPYQHSQRVERHIQTLFGHARAVTYGLSYVLPPALYGELLAACCYSINMLPNSKRPGASPHGMLTGRPFNAQKGLLRFGTIAMANEAGKPNKHSLDKRADMVIVLGPSLISSGSYRVYSLTSRSVMTRHKFKLLEHIPKDFPFPRQRMSMEMGEFCHRLEDQPAAAHGSSEPEYDLRPIFNDLPLHESVEIRRVTAPTTTAVARESDGEHDSPANPHDLQDNEAEPALSFSPSPIEVEDTSYSVPMAHETASSEGEFEAATEPTREQTAQPTRKSTRTRVPRKWFDSLRKAESDYSAAYRISIKEGLQGERSQQCKEAIRAEIQNMMHYHVGKYVRYEDIPRSLRRNILHTFMFLKHKETPTGAYDKTKARLVGNGAHQGDHMYNLVASATVYLTSVFVIMNIASYYWCQLVSIDIKGAFLNAKFGPADPVTYIRVNREVTDEWLKVDPECAQYVGSDGQLTLQLDKFIYGLKQAPYMFQQHLVAFLQRIGYTRLINDECVFMKYISSDKWSYLCTHVDDILQASNSQELVDELKEELTKEYEQITHHAKADAYIGISIEHIKRMEAYHLTQRGLVQRTIDEFLRGDTKSDPADPATDELLKADHGDQTPTDGKKFLSLVMTLMYVARLTRPDILVAVTVLSTRCSKPTAQDMTHALRVLRYLRGTIDYGILIQCTDLSAHGSSDASYNIHSDGKGHTGYVVGIGPNNSIVHVKSVKQKLTAQSSTDAELIALNECTKMVIHIRQLLTEMRIPPRTESVIEQDNQSAILLVEERGSSKRSKYLLPKIGYIREQVQLGKIRVNYVPTDCIRSDCLTKPLHGQAYKTKSRCLVRASPNK